MPNTSVNTNGNTIVTKNSREFNRGRWIIIGVLFVINVLLFIFPQAISVIRTSSTLIIAIFTFIHGTKRYGFKNIVIFFVITWLISNTFESLSIATGFPFGHYHYNLTPGPRLMNVPLIIMPAYFGMGYMSWILSNVLIGQYGKKIRRIQIFLVPFIASFIMVMWDVVMDPGASTIRKMWLWEDGGNYFGVPISNYMGWFFVVYLFTQVFAIFISKADTNENESQFGKTFWIEAAIVYGIQGCSFITTAFTQSTNKEINSSTALVCVFTMIFVTILSLISITNSKEII